MKILSVLGVITTFIFCQNQTIKQQESNNTAIQVVSKKDTLPEMNLLDSEYLVRERMTDAALKTMLPNVPTMNVKALNKAFYKYFKGTFNGESAIVNLNFGHFTYAGGLAFDGTLFVNSKQKLYEIWGEKSDTTSVLRLYVSDKGEANFDNLFILLAHFDDKMILKGLSLGCC